ncbi:MAG: patatin-like phospholipase family protein [Gammaproteobacteria bacterium]|jgi:NTE family protein
MGTAKPAESGIHSVPHWANVGLILPGGGARAAYQVGVLRAIARIVPRGAPSPFNVISGTSAGAINAAAVAAYADRFSAGVSALNSVWRNFTTDQVFRTDPWSMLQASLHWMASILTGGLGPFNPRSLLDNRPLWQLLRERIPLHRIDSNLAAGFLRAVAVNLSSYHSARSVCFFQSGPSVAGWERSRRAGVRSRLSVEHLVASAAVPMIFPAVRLGDEFYGDGAMRQQSPLSPAIQMGAQRLLVIGVRDEKTHGGPRPRRPERPSLGQIAGYMLDTIFMDGLYTDIERITRINQLLEQVRTDKLPPQLRHLRRVETLVILPSQNIRELAARHARALPLPLRLLLRGVGASSHGQGQLLSYLLFEKGFTRALIRMGHDDAMARRDHIEALLGGQPMPVLDAPDEVVGDISGQ